MVDQLTPQAVFSLYVQLSEQNKREFLSLIGSFGNWSAPIAVAVGMTNTQQFEFSKATMAQMVENLIPIFVQHAIEIIREKPDISDSDFAKEVASKTREWGEKIARETAGLEREKLKAQRDRKSDPEIVRRNVEICDLRGRDPKKWTQGRLAKQFKINAATIRRILSQEQKWRRLQG